MITPNDNQSLSTTASYNTWLADGEMTGMKYLLPGGGYYTETRPYNAQLQLTQLTATGSGVPGVKSAFGRRGQAALRVVGHPRRRLRATEQSCPI